MRSSILLVSSSLALAVTAIPRESRAGTELFGPANAMSNACGASDGCWTNYLRVTDLDGDQQLDVVTVNMQGFFSVGSGEPLVVYSNEGGSFSNVSAQAVGGHEGQHRQVAVGDVDGDGDADIYAPHAAGGSDSLFINEGGMTFTETSIDNGSEAGAARLGDLDQDGDLDLFLTHSYPDGNAPVSPVARVWLNDGNGVFSELAGATPSELDGSQPIDVDLFDADGDLDLDALINTHDGDLGLWLNAGDATFDAAPQQPDAASGYHYGPGVCDVDGDGDLDFWVDNAGPNYTEQLQINDGSGGFTDETAARVSGNPGSDDNGVVCVDLDYDGDFDAVVVSLGSRERYLENDGTGNFTYLANVFPSHPAQGGNPPTVPSLWAELGDLDGDGRLDIVTGSGESGTQENFYLGSDAQVVDARPPGFRVVEALADVAADTPQLLRFAVTDSSVTDEGPRLERAFVRVSVDGGDATEVTATFIGGDLFRAELPGQSGGTVTYTACAVDWAGNEGCAAEAAYDVGGGASDTGGTGSDSGPSTDSDTADTSAGPGSASNSASDTATDPSGASASATVDDSGSTGGGSGQDEGGGGCSCRQSTPNGFGTTVLAVFALVLGRRRTARRRA